jgi:hypothetical protein
VVQIMAKSFLLVTCITNMGKSGQVKDSYLKTDISPFFWFKVQDQKSPFGL